MKVLLNSDGYVDGYALIGDILDSIEVADLTTEEFAKFETSYRAYKVDENGVLILDANKLASLQEETNTPTQLDRIEAQITYTAMMTDTLLEAE